MRVVETGAGSLAAFLTPLEGEESPARRRQDQIPSRDKRHRDQRQWRAKGPQYEEGNTMADLIAIGMKP